MRKLTDEEEWDRIERRLMEELRTPMNSWKREPRWLRLLELHKQAEEQLPNMSGESSDDKID